MRPVRKYGVVVRAALLFLAGCAVAAPALPPAVTASPGRLAGAPATLRPGVVVYPDVPVVRAAPAEHHHHHP